MKLVVEVEVKVRSSSCAVPRWVLILMLMLTSIRGNVDPSALRALTARPPRLRELYDEITPGIYSVPPYGLGYPGEAT